MTIKSCVKVVSYLFICSFALSACSNDDDPTDPIPGDDDVKPGDPGTITCTIDGEKFASGSLLTTGSLSTNDDFFTLGGVGVDFLDSDTLGIVFAMIGTNFSSLQSGQVFKSDQNSIVNTVTAQLSIDRKPAVEIRARTFGSNADIFTLTGINRDEGVYSGTFSFDAKDEDTGVTYEVRDGIFTDIPYK